MHIKSTFESRISSVEQNQYDFQKLAEPEEAKIIIENNTQCNFSRLVRRPDVDNSIYSANVLMLF